MKVFISYRRNDQTAYLASHLRDELVQGLGLDNVFLDIDDIPLGWDFHSIIRGRVEGANVVLALIGVHWEERRLFATTDFVRVELLAANELGKLIIPVLVGGRAMPKRESLPEPLRFISERNAADIAAPPRHKDDIARLVEYLRRLKSLLPGTSPHNAMEASVAGHFSANDLSIVGLLPAEWRDVPAAELGNPPPEGVAARFRAVADYASANGFVGGFPNFHQREASSSIAFGTVLLHRIE